MAERIIVGFGSQYAAEIRRFRNAVFTDEQHIDESKDFDGQDQDAVHVLVRSQGKFVGTGRMLPDGHIGRLAVLPAYRGQGFGAKLVQALLIEASSRGLKRVYLGAQKQVVGFYRKLGFSEHGEPYMELNIEHIHMDRML
jgi:predicted GNAT family N-acyltransferase